MASPSINDLRSIFYGGRMVQAEYDFLVAAAAAGVNALDLITLAVNQPDGSLSKISVIHGAVAGTARPAVAGSVEWVGSVEPANAINNDTWVNTA